MQQTDDEQKLSEASFAMYCAVILNLRIAWSALMAVDSPFAHDEAETIEATIISIEQLLASDVGEDISTFDAAHWLYLQSLP